MNMNVRPQIVLVPYPAQGHVTPLLHLARALSDHGFRPVLAVPDFIHSRTMARYTDTIGGDRATFVSVHTGLGAGEGNRDFFEIDRAMENCMPVHFEAVLRGLELEGGAVACVVVDLLASWAIGVAARVGIPAAGFWPAMLATYRVVSALPELIRRGFISDSGTPLYDQYNQPLLKKEEEEEKTKRCKLSTEDLPWLVGNSASQKSRFKFWLRTMARAATLSCLLVNSFPDEEGEEDEDHGRPDHGPAEYGPRIFHIGPLMPAHNINGSSNTLREEDKSCMQWLDTQPPNSVVYVSFGSWVGPIGPEGIAELALGLEATNRPFLWALRDDDPAWRDGLPDGFRNRTAARGKVIGWAPQESVLAHRAVGCYVTHCGWNSTVEGIRHGKRMVCYPISGDQFLNCKYMVGAWGIGVRPDGFGRRAIEESVGRVMEGEEGEEIGRRVVGLREKVMRGEGRNNAKNNLKLFVNLLRKGL